MRRQRGVPVARAESQLAPSLASFFVFLSVASVSHHHHRHYGHHFSPSTAKGSRGGGGGHALSKASGRESALRSPLRFDESVRARMRAELQRQQQQQQQQQRQQQGKHAGQRTDTAGEPTWRFGSTHTHRSGAAFSDKKRGATSANSTIAGSATPSPLEKAKRREPARSPLVLPYAELAYRSRLQHARLATLPELADAPYAPSPLQVLLDVLGRVSSLRALLDRWEGGGAATPAGQATQSGFGVVSASPGAAGEERKEAQEALARLTAALARAQDVRRILARVVEAATDTVAAVDVIGDRDSVAALQSTVELVERFARTVLSSYESSPEGGEAIVAAELPQATRAEVLHAIVDLGSVLGSRLTAVAALDELIALSEIAAAGTAHGTANATTGDGHRGDEESEATEAEFSVDDAVAIADREMQSELRPVAAADHLRAIESCQKLRDFDLAISLYRRFTQHTAAGAFAVTVDDLSQALTALAGCSNTAVHFEQLQHLLIRSEAASTVPVTVPLYTALIDAVSRAADHPKRMSIALALYRRLRDGMLTPTTETYAALMACCAAAREPTHAFAFYQEARMVCGVASFTPQLYTNLLLSYANAGYGADARRTLDVLVEAGAPLTRAAFHAVLSGAETLREAQEVLEMMTSRYAIQPTPHTYAFLVRAAATAPRGADTALQLFDLHEEALASLLDMDADRPPPEHGGAEGKSVATSSADQAGALEAKLLEQFPLYVRAVDHALMRLRLDPRMDSRLEKYLRPMLRVAQQRMNAFTGGMAPQAPTRIPHGADACIAVLAPDVLANLDELVEPFVSFYSAIVIPYSALLALQSGGGKRIEGLTVKGAQAGLYDDVWADAGDERSAVVEHRRRRLVKFLEDYREVIHLVSLEEELQWGRDLRRYHISATNWIARSAAFAINLARRDVPGGTKLYAQHAEAAIVLVSADYHNAGKYIVDLKKAYLTERDDGTRGGRHDDDDDPYMGLREGLAKVFYHNPLTRPAWSPPRLSIRRAGRPPRRLVGAVGTTTAGTQRAGAEGSTEARRGVPFTEEMDPKEVEELYRQRLLALEEERSPTAGDPHPAGGGIATQDSPAAFGNEDALDADLLMSLMADDE